MARHACLPLFVRAVSQSSVCHGSLSLDHHRDTRVGNTCIHQARLKISLTPIQPRHSTRMSDLTSTTRVLIALIGRRLLGTIHNPAVLENVAEINHVFAYLYYEMLEETQHKVKNQVYD